MAIPIRVPGAHADASTLVAARATLLRHMGQHASWKAAETRIAESLRALFSAHPPQLRRLDMQTAPAILDQIVRFEAVHAVRGLFDLRRRLENDRRCYALFSDALPDEPLVFIELAFTQGLAGDVTALLDTQSVIADPASCDSAMFYSISSCHEGLRGIPFGNLLIRLAVERLQQELPWLTTFATVSPVPGFRAWLAQQAERRGADLRRIVDILDAGEWTSRPALSAQLEALLMPLCAAYLVHAKRGNEPLDPVARFHLGNGARLERINWNGDRSKAGYERSAGIVANYVYDVAAIDTNRETYASTHNVMAAPSVEHLAGVAA